MDRPAHPCSVDKGDSVGALQSAAKAVTMAETPLSASSKVTVERHGQIVLIGINRPSIQNRVDPETYLGLAKAYYQYEHDPSLRAAVLFGHGDNFSRGIDVDAFQALAASGRPFLSDPEIIDPLPKTKGLSKPLIVVVHGDTWNMGHELHLVAHTNCRRRYAIWSGREHARPLSGRRLYSPFRARSRMGERDALHADRRPLER